MNARIVNTYLATSSNITLTTYYVGTHNKQNLYLPFLGLHLIVDLHRTKPRHNLTISKYNFTHCAASYYDSNLQVIII